VNIIKTNVIQDGIKINYLSTENWQRYENLLFFYDAITWDLKVYSFSSDSWKEEVTNKEIYITFSYMNATSSSLQKKLTYFRNTNIVDYD
jgi:hypothetical protein